MSAISASTNSRSWFSALPRRLAVQAARAKRSAEECRRLRFHPAESLRVRRAHLAEVALRAVAQAAVSNLLTPVFFQVWKSEI